MGLCALMPARGGGACGGTLCSAVLCCLPVGEVRVVGKCVLSACSWERCVEPLGGKV